jgi:hypothetical protein
MGFNKWVAQPAEYGHDLPAMQPLSMNDFKLASVNVLIDERVVAALDQRRPIGMSRTAWVNYLLQYALGQHPDIFDVRGIEA